MLTPRNWSISLPEYANFFRKETHLSGNMFLRIPIGNYIRHYSGCRRHGSYPCYKIATPPNHMDIVHRTAWKKFSAPAILRATRSTMMGARTPNTPASNLTVYWTAWRWASSSSSSPPRENRIDPNAQEQKANCQNADFHIAFLSVVCLVISFT